MHSHRRISAIDTNIILRRAPHSIISVHKSVRHSTIIRHSKVINTLAQAIFISLRLRRAANVPLVGNLAAIDLVVNALTRVLPAVQEEIVEEWRDGVLRDGRVWEMVGLEL